MQGRKGHGRDTGDSEDEQVVFFDAERAAVNEVSDEPVNEIHDQADQGYADHTENPRRRHRRDAGEKDVPGYERFIPEKGVGDLSRVFRFVFACGPEQSEVSRRAFNRAQHAGDNQLICAAHRAIQNKDIEGDENVYRRYERQKA